MGVSVVEVHVVDFDTQHPNPHPDQRPIPGSQLSLGHAQKVDMRDPDHPGHPDGSPPGIFETREETNSARVRPRINRPQRPSHTQAHISWLDRRNWDTAHPIGLPDRELTLFEQQLLVSDVAFFKSSFAVGEIEVPQSHKSLV
jgi:hypothetical protein